MKADAKFYHNKKGFDAFGVTEKRTKEIDVFMKALITEARILEYKKSQLFERIIEFADNTVEACLMCAHLERIHSATEVHFIGTGEMPPELREALDELKKHVQMIRGSKGGGMSVDPNGNINMN